MRSPVIAITIATFAVSSAIVVACSTDDTASTTPETQDSSTPIESGTDTGTPVVTTDGGDAAAPDGAPASIPPTFAIVHAAPELGTILGCTKVAGGFQPGQVPYVIPPLVGAPVALSANDAFAFAAFASQDILIRADAVTPLADGGLPTCAAITNGSAGVSADAIFEAALVPAGTYKAGHSYLWAILGCGGGNDAGAYACGSDYKGTPTVREVTVELDGVTNPGTTIGAQFVHLSPQMDGLVPTGVAPAFGIAGDAGADAAAKLNFISVGGGVTYAASPTAAAPAKAVAVPGALSNLDSNTFSLFNNVDGGVPNAPFEPPFDVPLSVVAYSTTGDPGAVATYFKAGKNYTFILLGDPLVAAGADNNGARILALPNN